MVNRYLPCMELLLSSACFSSKFPRKRELSALVDRDVITRSIHIYDQTLSIISTGNEYKYSQGMVLLSVNPSFKRICKVFLRLSRSCVNIILTCSYLFVLGQCGVRFAKHMQLCNEEYFISLVFYVTHFH